MKRADNISEAINDKLICILKLEISLSVYLKSYILNAACKYHDSCNKLSISF